jgi:hypothetical protein
VNAPFDAGALYRSADGLRWTRTVIRPEIRPEIRPD